MNVELQPLGKSVTVPPGTELRDVLFAHGVEFPCGGRGRCKGCRVKLLSGSLTPTVEDQRLLSERELAEGWRLSCRARAESDLVLDLAQWESPILGDNTPFRFVPREGFGVAIDLGTTTIVGQLVDLTTGKVIAVRTGLNEQAAHGGDIMSRIDFAMNDCSHSLTSLIRRQIGALTSQLLEEHPKAGELTRVAIVGNTVMHHLFCGLSVEPLSRHPFETTQGDLQSFTSAELGWNLPKSSRIDFLPCLGGFVGSDILAGVLALRLHESEELSVFIDLGTNGEMVVGNRERLLCASTAAGPAFEGARISMGMRAATGAISEASVVDGSMIARVIGGGTARGICGSGLVDAIAGGLSIGAIEPNGRLSARKPVAVQDPVSISQSDVRELQLAKGAIAAGVQLLLHRWGASLEDVKRVHLAGAFGNYINRASAWRVGLLNFDPNQVQPAGNTALLGAKLALFDEELQYGNIRSRLEHVPLADEPDFQEVFVRELAFPTRTSPPITAQ